MLKKEVIKKFWKPFIVLFLLNFLIINWSDVSWLFNYRALGGVVSDFFSKNSSVLIAALSQEIKETPAVTKRFEYSEKENSIVIPKIQIEAPLVLIPEGRESENMRKFLDLGTVLYPGSTLPGETGQTIILGHSAPPGWPKIKHDWVFSKVNDLLEGDEIIIYFNHQKITYQVTEKTILEKGAEVPANPLTDSENVLVLLSCWPPGKNIKRIAVEAVLK